jgi:hypothetical protein
MKYLRYQERDTAHYFWRTTQQQEVDLVEEEDGILSAFEFKWGKAEKVRIPRTFTQNYPEVITKIISRENVEEITTSLQ